MNEVLFSVSFSKVQFQFSNQEDVFTSSTLLEDDMISILKFRA